MPIYEFRCTECNRTEEYLQKVSDPAPLECALCGSKNQLEKVVSQTSFQLKGGGWYNDLYASPKKESTDKSSPAQTPSAPKKPDSPSSI